MQFSRSCRRADLPLFSQADREKRIGHVLQGAISAVSIPWLFYVWQDVESQAEVPALRWGVASYLPIWILWLILEKQGEKLQRASKALVSSSCIPWLIYASAEARIMNSEWFATRNMELMIHASWFGMFWVFGAWVRDYAIKVFEKKGTAG